MRQLVAILFSDMVGYSRQVDQDEAGALARLEVHNRLMQEAIRRYEGTVIKTVGDAFVATFPSGVSAVEAALDAQRSFELHNSIAGNAEQIQVRIGVHAGDVVMRDGDLFGEAVNVAARLEPLAPGGGVAISRTIYEQVRRKVRAEIEDRGMVPLKNIAEPVQVYVLKPGPEPVELESSALLARSRRTMIVLGGSAVAAVAVAGGWRLLRPGKRSSARRGGDLRVAVGAPSEPFNYYSPSFTRNHWAILLLVDPLLLPANHSADRTSVLEAVQPSEDGLRVLLSLRRNVFFHDHPTFPNGTGRRADGGDLAFSIRAAVENGGVDIPIRGMKDGKLNDANALERTSNAWELLLHLSRAAAFVPFALSDIPLLPAELESKEDLGNIRQPVGTGPFRFTSPPTSDSLRLVREPRYWNSGLPYLDSIEIIDGTDTRGSLTTFSEHGIDAFAPGGPEVGAIVDLTGIRPTLRSEWSKLDASAGARPASDYCVLFGMLVLRKPGPLAEQKVRQAIGLAIDRQAMIAAAARERPDRIRIPYGRFLWTDMLGFDPSVRPLETDLSRARNLLAECGHPGGEGVREILLASVLSGAAEVAAEGMRAIGLKVRVQAVSDASTSDLLSRKAADLFLAHIHNEVYENEAPTFLSSMVEWGPNSPRSDALIEKLSTTLARLDRAPLYAALEGVLLDELPVIPVGWQIGPPFREPIIFRRNLHGLADETTGVAYVQDFRRAWLDRRS